CCAFYPALQPTPPPPRLRLAPPRPSPRTNANTWLSTPWPAHSPSHASPSSTRSAASSSTNRPTGPSAPYAMPSTPAPTTTATATYRRAPRRRLAAGTCAARRGESVGRDSCAGAIVADGGTALRAAHESAVPDVPRRRDVFHAFYEEVAPLTRSLEARAYQAI